jgi:DUF1680 family protein
MNNDSNIQIHKYSNSQIYSLMRQISLTIALVFFAFAAQAQSGWQYRPVNFSKVNITDAFWKPRMETVATVTMDACIYQTEQRTPRIRNFEKVARRKGEKHEGIYYDDSDVYKAIEAMAYSLRTRRDSALEAKADEWIDKIAAAQEPDGYLNTYYSLRGLQGRWTDVEKHEDYNAGHLIEAAVAYYDVTGKRKFLDVAIRLANHIDSTLYRSGRKWISGHQEIELALVKLHRVTGDARYIELADWYIRSRGSQFPYQSAWLTPAYWQDLKPVTEQTEITGHAVRAMYLFSGVADMAAIKKNKDYLQAMERIWEDVVHRNMYVTGGIGSAGDNEGFSVDYDLPNEEAYCETCASVGMVFWNARMSQLTGNSKYYDVLERSLYNGALDGLSLSGDRFFYDKPLASNGRHTRKAWFGTACCPANIARLVASLGNYVYGEEKDQVWVNLFVASDAELSMGGTPMKLKMETNYPWDGKISLQTSLNKKRRFQIRIRIPGWFQGKMVDGDLYQSASDDGVNDIFDPTVNGKAVPYKVENGYIVVDNTWKEGDRLEMEFPLETQLLVSRKEVAANRDRMALQRGPLVYCVEGADNPAGVWNLLMEPSASWKPVNHTIQGHQLTALKGEIWELVPDASGMDVQLRKREVTAIPYYTWANRQPNDMQVWLPSKIHSLMINNSNKKSDGGNY